MSDNKPYDLLLRGGQVICPASGINGVMDVAVRDGKIAAVQKDILPATAKATPSTAMNAGSRTSKRAPTITPIMK